MRNTVKGAIKIEGLKIHFPCASLLQVKKSGILNSLSDNTYLSKPVVTIDKQTVLFGEVAILKYLEKDGWKGVWVDAFHSSRTNDILWSDMPPQGIAPPLPPKVSEKFNSIKEKNGGRLSGFFDVFAWKGDSDAYLFIEYKGKDDSSNDNELAWINAAASTGVKPEQLAIVGYDLPV
jgi:hypothetical protein